MRFWILNIFSKSHFIFYYCFNAVIVLHILHLAFGMLHLLIHKSHIKLMVAFYFLLWFRSLILINHSQLFQFDLYQVWFQMHTTLHFLVLLYYQFHYLYKFVNNNPWLFHFLIRDFFVFQSVIFDFNPISFALKIYVFLY